MDPHVKQDPEPEPEPEPERASIPAMAAAYSIPDPAITELVDAPPTPTLSVDPTRSYALQLEPLGMPSIEERALPELKLGGMRFSPDLLFPTRMDSNGGRMGTAPLLLELPAPGSDAAPAGLAFVGLPAGHALSFVTWAPTGGKLAFMARPGGQASAHYELWIADWSTGAAACSQLLPSHRFNAVTGPPYVWSKDGERLLVKTVPASLGPVPAAPAAPPGPTIQDNSDGAAAAARTYQDMISSPHDEMLFAHCSTCALLLLTLSSGEALTVGPAEGMMLRGSHAPSNSGMVDGALAVSPDGRYIVSQRFESPFSYSEQFSKFAYTTEVFSAETGELCSSVFSSPLQESVPTHTDGVVTGPRSMKWVPFLDATLIFAAAADGGDPEADVGPDGVRDELFLLEEPFDLQSARLALQMSLRYRRLVFVPPGDEGSGAAAIVSESRWSDRKLKECKPHDYRWHLGCVFQRFQR